MPDRRLRCRGLLVACASFAAVVYPATSLDGSPAQHASHPLAPMALEILQRPASMAAGIGRAHDDAETASPEAQAMYDQGLAYLHSYVWIEAARSFNAALALDSKLALAHVGLSVAYVEVSRPADARTAIDTAHTLAAGRSDHLRRHVELRTLQMHAEEAPADTARLQTYRKALDAALATYPQDVELLLLRGMAESPDPAERGQGSIAASVPFYERARALDPAHVAAPHYLTHAAENSGQRGEALAHSEAYVTQAPAVPHAHHMRGHNLRRAARAHEAIAAFESADRLHREYSKREQIAAEYDWHFEHNLGLLATALQYTGQMKRAEALFKAAFALPTGLLVQAYNKRDWPMFLRGRGRLKEAEAAARELVAHPNAVVQATGHIELGLVALAANQYAAAGAASNTALRLLRTAPGGPIAANALLALQGEFHLRTAARDKGRATLEEVARRLRAAPGPDAWSQALFSLEGMARTAREVGDWELAGRLARQLIEHDPGYAGGHYAAGLAAEHTGDAAAAAAAFAQSLKLWARADADLPEMTELRRKLKR